VVSWGAMMRTTLKAIEQMKERREISVELIDLLTISPLDSRTIVESVKKTGRCVIVQEAPKTLGLASEIIARLNDDALLYLEAPIKRVTQYDVVTPYFGREEMFLPDPPHIIDSITATVDF
jgi:pyruvate dehydrogenase E1 component beta subunit